MINTYAHVGPIGGYSLGLTLAGAAALMWIGVYFYFLVFFKRKERQDLKTRNMTRLQPPAPKKGAGRKPSASADEASWLGPKF